MNHYYRFPLQKKENPLVKLGTISHALLELIFHSISVLPLNALETWDVRGFLVNQTTPISKDNDWSLVWFSFWYMSYMYL